MSGYSPAAGGRPANIVTRWNGATWSALGAGVDNRVYGLADFQNELVVAGSFLRAGGQTSAYLARWGCPFEAGDVNCDGAIDAMDIEPFLLALFDPDGYARSYPDCDIDLADVNGDGILNAFDIEPFLGLLFP